MSLVAERVRVSHDGQVVIDELSISIDRGRVVGLSGPSGVGKTTLARALCGLLPVDAGRVSIDGRAVITRRGAMGGAVTMLFQSPRRSVSPRLRLAEVIAEPLRAQASDPRVRELADEVGLTRDLLGRLPAEVSDGQLQRAALARALATDPRYLICDEATAALDALTTAALVAKINKRVTAGLGLLVISHDQELLAAWADERQELTAAGLQCG